MKQKKSDTSDFPNIQRAASPSDGAVLLLTELLGAISFAHAIALRKNPSHLSNMAKQNDAKCKVPGRSSRNRVN